MIQTNEKTGKKIYFCAPSYCDEGQSVYVEKNNRWRPAKVIAAHGHHGRVVNEELGIDRLSHIGDMRIVKPFTPKDYLRDLRWSPVKKGKKTMWKQPEQWWEYGTDKPTLTLSEACEAAGVNLG